MRLCDAYYLIITVTFLYNIVQEINWTKKENISISYFNSLLIYI